MIGSNHQKHFKFIDLNNFLSEKELQTLMEHIVQTDVFGMETRQDDSNCATDTYHVVNIEFLNPKNLKSSAISYSKLKINQLTNSNTIKHTNSNLKSYS